MVVSSSVTARCCCRTSSIRSCVQQYNLRSAARTSSCLWEALHQLAELVVEGLTSVSVGGVGPVTRCLGGVDEDHRLRVQPGTMHTHLHLAGRCCLRWLSPECSASRAITTQPSC